MENVNENAAAVPENVVVPATTPTASAKKTFRPGSLSAVAQTLILAMTGEFNIKDVVNKYTEECVKLNEQPGNALRNCRLVVTAMLHDGVLVKVSRGRWKKA